MDCVRVSCCSNTVLHLHESGGGMCSLGNLVCYIRVKAAEGTRRETTLHFTLVKLTEATTLISLVLFSSRAFKAFNCITVWLFSHKTLTIVSKCLRKSNKNHFSHTKCDNSALSWTFLIRYLRLTKLWSLQSIMNH